MTPERVDWHLENWRAWLGRRPSMLDFPSKSSGMVGGGYNTDFDTMCAEADDRCALAVDALIDGLPTQERLAIHNQYNVAVYHLRDQDVSLMAAKDRLADLLNKRGVY